MNRKTTTVVTIAAVAVLAVLALLAFLPRAGQSPTPTPAPTVAQQPATSSPTPTPSPTATSPTESENGPDGELPNGPAEDAGFAAAFVREYVTFNTAESADARAARLTPYTVSDSILSRIPTAAGGNSVDTTTKAIVTVVNGNPSGSWAESLDNLDQTYAVSLSWTTTATLGGSVFVTGPFTQVLFVTVHNVGYPVVVDVAESAAL